MPYVRINTNLELSNEQLHTLMSKAAELIVLLPNKKPERTMVEVNAGKQMYFALNDEACAYVHVDLYKACAFDAKSAYSRALSELLQETTGIESGRIYLTMAEYDNWGYGEGFAE